MSQFYKVPKSHKMSSHGEQFDFPSVFKANSHLGKCPANEGDYVTDGKFVLKRVQNKWYIKAYLLEAKLYTVHPEVAQIPVIIPNTPQHYLIIDFEQFAPYCPVNFQIQLSKCLARMFWLNFDNEEMCRASLLDHDQGYLPLIAHNALVKTRLIDHEFVNWRLKRRQKHFSQDSEPNLVQISTGMVYSFQGYRAVLVGKCIENQYTRIKDGPQLTLMADQFPILFVPEWMPLHNPFAVYLLYHVCTGLGDCFDDQLRVGPTELCHHPAGYGVPSQQPTQSHSAKNRRCRRKKAMPQKGDAAKS